MALKVLISGTGIAVTVVERFPELRTSGLQVDILGQGIEVLRPMGIENAFRNISVPEQDMQVVDNAHKRWAYFPANRSGTGPQGFTSHFEIMRGDLCWIIYDTTRTSFEKKGAALDFLFTSEERARYDILVGADGQGSRTRKIMLQEYIATSYIAPGDRFVLTRRYNPQRIQVYLIGKSVTKRLGGVHKWDVSEEKKAFAEVFRGAGRQVEGILESLMEADNFYCETQGLVKLNLWYQGRVVLLGDAAYSHSAITDMGTSSAIVGAYILAGEIGVHCPGDGADDSHTTAFRAYDNKFRPFMDQVQTGVGNSSIFDNIPWSPLTISVLYWVLWLASCLRLDLLRGLLGDQPVKGWELPEYGILMDDAKTHRGL
ncbi:hypothetical protein BDW60DRAFT_220638 [Aspergillus nidulans var. acristatus]